MKKLIVLCCLLISSAVISQNAEVVSPDGKLKLNVSVENGKTTYSVTYNNKVMLENSPLGLITNEGNFTENMTFVESTSDKVNKSYNQEKIKQSSIIYEANTLKFTIENADKKQLSIVFQLSNNDIAFRYEIPIWGETMSCVVEKEITGYKFPSSTTTFLSSMMSPMSGFARTTPSYESSYTSDVAMETNTDKNGYVFPGLFRIGNNGWVLLSETGVSSLYNASHLSSYTNGMYSVEYPDVKTNNGFGSVGAQVGLPGMTPWRTITVGETLKPIVETTISYDVVDPLYEASQDYKYGRGSWSWIVWQDASMNYEDQVKYIDLAAAMNFEYILIDAWWDKNIGYDRMKELIQYAKSKGVDVFLWYNSNGIVNDAFQTPKDKMNTSIVRKNEMKWLKEAGVKGLKVDFFGGDKQETMRLYEDILSDANDYGLMIIFHGATLPRGWERMYPNFVGSEAVIASEMLIFTQDARNKESYYASLHPFIRNSVASMEFGGVLLNKFLNKGNTRGQERLTTNMFQLATSVLFQNPLQMFALTPNNLEDTPAYQLDFLRTVPTTWDETVFIDGYPGKHVVLARRHGDKWYIAGVNANKETLKIKVKLPMISAGDELNIYADGEQSKNGVITSKLKKNQEIELTIPTNGGVLIVN
ncbi:glycoside hydrolase family 97 protein [Confluentibacter flavum]|uniref:Alpha-glucosidase n=1 Tax=Confluentibacter flavum TaxID=1909700 RepID=A0A2N3HJJ2_9FLAO|nr:glycoside hydrolase family 97 protein [Confluentibacter flavum]PKQ45150.1 alpha-glucosidase [Confluentibacter flavum]